MMAKYLLLSLLLLFSFSKHQANAKAIVVTFPEPVSQCTLDAMSAEAEGAPVGLCDDVDDRRQLRGGQEHESNHRELPIGCSSYCLNYCYYWKPGSCWYWDTDYNCRKCRRNRFLSDSGENQQGAPADQDTRTLKKSRCADLDKIVKKAKDGARKAQKKDKAKDKVKVNLDQAKVVCLENFEEKKK